MDSTKKDSKCQSSLTEVEEKEEKRLKKKEAARKAYQEKVKHLTEEEKIQRRAKWKEAYRRKKEKGAAMRDDSFDLIQEEKNDEDTEAKEAYHKRKRKIVVLEDGSYFEVSSVVNTKQKKLTEEDMIKQRAKWKEDYRHKKEKAAASKDDHNSETGCVDIKKKVLSDEEKNQKNARRRDAYRKRKDKLAELGIVPATPKRKQLSEEEKNIKNAKQRDVYRKRKAKMAARRAEQAKKVTGMEKGNVIEAVVLTNEEEEAKRARYKLAKLRRKHREFEKILLSRKRRIQELSHQDFPLGSETPVTDQKIESTDKEDYVQSEVFHHDEIREVLPQLIEDEEYSSSQAYDKPTGYFIPQLIKKFQENIKEGPTWICSCCGRLFFKKGVSAVTDDMIKSWGHDENKRKLVLWVKQTSHFLCHSCKDSSKKKKIPRMALSNGLEFPVIPPELQYLTQLEERLVAGRIPFMQIQLVGFQKQWILRGNVVNVPNNLDKAITCLPRNFEDTAMIQLKLMRRMMYKNPYLYAKIRPAKVIAAAKYLINSPLYQAEGITLSSEWANKYNDYEVNFQLEEDDELNRNQVELDNENEPMEEYTEGENAQVDDVQTLLFRPDLTPEGLKIAPGEGNVPIPYYKDPNAGLLSFPSIYCGELIDYKIKLNLSEIVRSELMRHDRRCADPEKILFDFKRIFNNRLKDAYYICLRQKAAHHNGKPLTAGHVRSDEGIRNILAKDDGYSCYKEVRSTPAYWQEECKKLMAMVRQRGCCTFFITLSAAESRWEDLLRILLGLQIKQQEKICDFLGLTQEELDRCLKEDILLLPHVARAKLISSDPVTCMRYFDFKYRELVNTLIKPERGVFDPYKLDDHYFRIEYQMRGSAHLHGMLWQGDAPRFDRNVEDSRKACIRFIDQHVSCSLDVDEELKGLVNSVQIHRHSQTCKKARRKVRVCRFNYPKPPLKSTLILDALPSEMEDAERKRLIQIYTCVEEFLNNKLGPKYNGSMTIDEMLAELDVGYEDYFKSIQTTFGKRTTVFLKRTTAECFVNAYNPHVLRAWKANMDLQFVLDGYACGKYVGSYISKAGGGVSKLLRAAAADVKDGNRSMKNKLEQFGDILIRGSEISAQEGTAFSIGMPMVNCSRSVVFAATGEIGSRIRMLKSKAELAKLEESSEEIYVRGPSYYYAHRPDDMEDVCYAEFLTKWTTSRQLKKEKERIENENDEPTEASEEIPHHDEQESRCQYKEREKHKILRFCNFSKTKDPSNYWREQLLLFVPWRNEVDEIEAPGNYHERAKEQEEIIINNSRPFYYSRKDITALDDPAADFYFEEVFEKSKNSDGESDDEDDEDQPQEKEFNLDEEDEINYTNETLTEKKGKQLQRFRPPRVCDNTEYLTIMRSLNALQQKFVLEVIYRLKTGADPFYFYLAGGAGVGKSQVVTAIVQCFLRYCHSLSNDRCPVESLPTIIGAPTGAAAFNVMGNTLHNLFRLPPNQQNNEIGPLEESVAQSLRVRFAHTKLFIIDEISMVGAIQLYYIDDRLRQIFQTNQEFGGKSLLVVGDFRQLPPIGMKSVYKCPNLPRTEKEREYLVSVNPLWQKFEYFELIEIMRQRDEHQFCKALNNCATGTMDDEDIALMKARIVSKEDAPRDAIWLFWSNLECEEFNRDYHDSLQTEGVFVKAEHVIASKDGGDFERLTALLAAEQLKRNETNGLLNSVNLQIGAIYFVTINIDVGDGLFNGASGELKAIERHEKTGEVVAAWLQFCHPSIGQNVRENHDVIIRQRKNKYARTWTPIGFRKVRLAKTKKLGNFEITRIMIPLQAANGMTICKSQGSSLPKVVVNLKDGMTRQLVYVACSRAIKYEDFYIVGNFKPPAPANDDDSNEIERLKENPLQFQLRFPSDFHQCSSVFYHNVGGFLKNLADIRSDRNILSHNYLIFAEPKLRQEAQIQLPGYRVHTRVDCSNDLAYLNSEGILLFVKDTAVNPLDARVIVDKDVSYGAKAIKGNSTILVVELEDCFLVAAYRSPKFCLRRFKESLETTLAPLWTKKAVIVFGDMNVNLQNEAHEFEWMISRGMKFMISTQSSTTNSNTNIDVCLSNHPNCEASVYEIYFTYHKALSMHF